MKYVRLRNNSRDFLASVYQGQAVRFEPAGQAGCVRDLLPEGAVIIRLVSNNTQLGIWVAWRDPVMHQAAGNELRAAGECPPNLDLDAVADATVRCLSWRISR